MQCLDHISGSRSTLTKTITTKITYSPTPTTNQSTLPTISSVTGGSTSKFHSTSTQKQEGNFGSNEPENPENAG